MTRPMNFMDIMVGIMPFKYMILNQLKINYFILLLRHKSCQCGETNLQKILPKPITNFEKENFLIKFTIELSQPSFFLTNGAGFWNNLDDESYQNLQNAMKS